MEHVICVNQNNQEIWTMEKILAHQSGGTLHRAFSVLLFNKKWELLIQQRSINKYHAPWLRANSCCSHPRKWELTIDAAKRRTQEELWIACNLNEWASFVYRADCGNNLTEHEHDTIFTGTIETNEIPFNKDEVMDIKRISIPNLKASLESEPQLYTPRFHQIAKILRK